MNICEYIKNIFSEISDKNFYDGTIVLRNDGKGDYVESWNYKKEIPEILKDKKIYKEMS